MDRLIEGRKHVGIEALSVLGRRPAHLVGGDPGSRRPALDGSSAHSEDGRPRDEVSSSGRQRVGPMAVIVPRGLHGRVDWLSVVLVTLGVVFRPNQLPEGGCKRE